LRDTREHWTLDCNVRGPGQATRFYNSVFNLGPACAVGPGQGVLLENCVVARTSINLRADDDDCELVLRRWACLANGSAGSVACDGRPWTSQPRIHAEDSVFIGGAVLTGSAQRARWSGKGNVYSLTSGFIYGHPIYTLAAWQKRWDSDRDSLVTPSP